LPAKITVGVDAIATGDQFGGVRRLVSSKTTIYGGCIGGLDTIVSAYWDPMLLEVISKPMSGAATPQGLKAGWNSCNFCCSK